MNWSNQSEQTSFYLQMMEKRLKKNDILRIIDEKIDFSFINQQCQKYYCNLGPTGYCPERLFRMLIVMYMDNIRSERQLSEKLSDSIRYMWFCKLDLDQEAPNHSTFSVLRTRLGDQLFKKIFENILNQMLKAKVVKPKSISVDSTSVLADVKVPSQDDKDVKVQGQQKISPQDPDARFGHTSPKKSFFGYKTQIMTDNDSGAILNVDAQPGNFDDKTLDPEFINEPVKEQELKIKEAALDKGFDSYALRHHFQKEKTKAAIPLKKFNTKLYGLDQFQMDVRKKKDICPAQKEMKYLSFDKKRKTYEFQGIGCASCPLKEQCTTGKVRRLSVHQLAPLKASAKAFNKTQLYKKISKKRSCVERVNAEAKRFHGLARAKFRRLWKFKIQCYLTATVINLKRVAHFFLKQVAQPFATAGP